MSALQALTATKFLRRTTLRDTEANTNFRMLDDDVAEAITSAEADVITPLMSKIYTRLLLTPSELREGERVLRFAGEEREGKWVTAWEQLRGQLRVSGETASKALRWMHSQGIIGYYSGKNGVGIRIFLNRAASSIRVRAGAKSQKILPFARASNGRPRTSSGETPFNDSFAVTEVLDIDLKPRAPKDGAESPTYNSPHGQTPRTNGVDPPDTSPRVESPAQTPPGPGVLVERLVARLKDELGPALRGLARQAAACEHERTREWLESKGLPKAARVAQRETYDALRRHGLLRDSPLNSRADVGRGDSAPAAPHKLSDGEVCELAEACVSLYEAKGQPVEVTLSEMNVASGGFLLPEDSARVLEKVEALHMLPPAREGREVS